jgi:hypothetical protein
MVSLVMRETTIYYKFLPEMLKQNAEPIPVIAHKFIGSASLRLAL